MTDSELAAIERVFRQTRWPVGMIAAIGTLQAGACAVLAAALAAEADGPWEFVLTLTVWAAFGGVLAALAWRYVWRVSALGQSGRDPGGLVLALRALRDLTAVVAVVVLLVHAGYVLSLLSALLVGR
jgi:hypothetical protein